jgi:hypothetical protein
MWVLYVIEIHSSGKAGIDVIMNTVISIFGAFACLLRCRNKYTCMSGDLMLVLKTFLPNQRPSNTQTVSRHPLKRHKSREGNNWYQVV